MILGIDTLQDWRDVVMIAFMIVGLLAFLAIFIVTVAFGFLGVGLMSRVRGIVKNNIQPAAENVKETTANIKGTVAFVSDNAVKPVVKAYGAAAGARRFVSVAAKFANRGKKEKA